MDLEARLNHLENTHEWHAMVEALEQGLTSAPSDVVKADLHLRLGRLLRDRFLQGVKALKHFQDAFKLNNQLTQALEEAREVYWELGKLNMVQKLLELQLKNTQEPSGASELCASLGDVLCDQADYDRATEAYAKSLQLAAGAPSRASSMLEDVQVAGGQWQAHGGSRLRAADEATDAQGKGGACLRAARLATRVAPEELAGILGQAYAADPSGTVPGALFEGYLVAQDQTDGIVEAQRRVLDALSGEAKSAVAYRFGVRWATRHQNLDLAKSLFEEALKADPSRDDAFSCLREIYAAEGNPSRALQVSEQLIQDATGASKNAALAAAGTIAWRQQGDLIRARGYFETLAGL